MKQTYIILLKNLHIKIQSKEPKKQGNYMKEVRLFKVNSDKKINYIMEWIDNNYKHDDVIEVLDWE